MRKSNINLLVNREDYQKYETIFNRFKMSALILTLLFALIFGLSFFSIKNQSDLYEKLNIEKKSYLEFINNHRDNEAKINYIEKKYNDLKNFLKDDASSVTYFELLSNSLKDTSDSAKLKSFEVDKTRDTSFTVSFSLFEKMMDFLKFAESESFLDNFENLSLKNLVIVGNKNNNENYELSFSGKFALINK
jgi:hypothetical protein